MGKKASKPSKGSTKDTTTTASPAAERKTSGTPKATDTSSSGADKKPGQKKPEKPKDSEGESEEESTLDDEEEKADEEDWDKRDDIYVRDEKYKKIDKDDFKLLAVIGKGSFGKVMQVEKKDTGEIFAMKVLRKETIIARKQVIHTKAEKAILAKISHPFIVNLHYAFQTPTKLYMILDYVNGGELFFHLKNEGKFKEDRVRFYCAEIAAALEHLHSYDIVYRDLKPENILLDSTGHITITDFGLSKVISKEGTQTFCGTPEYLAPEVLKGEGHGKPVDWWSLGTLVFEMLTGLPPFYSQNINIMYQKILNGELRFPGYVSEEAEDFLRGLLTRDVSKRLGSGPDDGGELRKHPWLASIDFGKLQKKELKAPFIPKVSGYRDTSQIDPVFIGEEAIDSLVADSKLTAVGGVKFEGFTFDGDSAMGTGHS